MSSPDPVRGRYHPIGKMFRGHAESPPPSWRTGKSAVKTGASSHRPQCQICCGASRAYPSRQTGHSNARPAGFPLIVRARYHCDCSLIFFLRVGSAIRSGCRVRAYAQTSNNRRKPRPHELTLPRKLFPRCRNRSRTRKERGPFLTAGGLLPLRRDQSAFQQSRDQVRGSWL